MNQNIYHLKIKTRKVQSFIFKVPKLKAMLGANSLLGEFFAVDLPDLRSGFPVPENWKTFVEKLDLSRYRWENDQEATDQNTGNDDLSANFAKGVICSAGGHFETLFSDHDNALTFAATTIGKAEEKIPGVQLSVLLRAVSDFDPFRMKYKDFQKPNAGHVIQIQGSSTQIHISNPYFYPSGEDGENPELMEKRSQSGDKQRDSDSDITKKIKEQGKHFYNGDGKDYLCRFLKQIAGADYKQVFPDDLNGLARLSLIPDNNKIAVVAIDGNAMGNRFQTVRKKYENRPVFDAMVDFEKFWFKQRMTFRKALCDSLNCIDLHPYQENGENKKKPYQIMMLGGDDLLLVTVPEIAIPFSLKLGERIKSIGQDLSVAVGIAVVKSKFPFAHAHELAESLLSSAKVKSRIWEKIDDKQGSERIQTTYRNAMDWHVHFPSGVLDINTIRRQNYFLDYNNEREILTRRPCTMAQAAEVWEKSIQLHEEVKRDDENPDESAMGRNKYKKFRALLKTGEKNVTLHSKLLGINKAYAQYVPLNSHEDTMKEKIKMNAALDIIELMDFHKRRQPAGEAE